MRTRLRAVQRFGATIIRLRLRLRQCGFGGNPIYASPIYASPIYASAVGASGQFASPIYASPIYASPIYASPIYASPIYASKYKSEGMRSSTARPVAEPERTEFKLPASEHIRAVVLDTGIAEEKWQPPLLKGLDHLCGDDPPDFNQDKWLDPASGHGTFIAGIIEQLAPGQDLWVRRVLSSFGDGDIAVDIVPMLYCLLRKVSSRRRQFSTCRSVATPTGRCSRWPARSGGYSEPERSSSPRPETTPPAAPPTPPPCPV